ncbi:hypothetical protein [Pseudescherichia vulneris]|uniref:hypothetical protein n=1 Tax=Pseudescherichia vulneris TaxID=566 RepID=UPI0028A58C69|nr:hypothetical protein [Pseudescherichia vulneris]
MAMDIFSGTHFRVSVGSAGTSVATDFQEVPEVAAFITSGFESATIDVVSFNSAFNRKLLGTKSVQDRDLKINFVPDNVIHQKLEQLAKDQKRCQIKLEYFTDETQTEGFYEVFHCFLGSSTTEGDKDQVVTKTFKLVADGGEIDSGLLQ